MSSTTRFEHPMARRTTAVLSFSKNGALFIGTLLVFGLLNVPARYTPADAGTSFPEFAVQSLTMSANASAETEASTTLSPRMQGALDYVEDRYDVSRTALQPLFEAAQRFGLERSVDPLLIVAVIAVESRFDPSARGGSARGLMQIIPRYHMEKLPPGQGRNALMNPIINVKVGTHILDEYISRRGSVVAGLQSYNGSAHKRSYAQKVLAVKQRLEVAAREALAKSRNSAT